MSFEHRLPPAYLKALKNSASWTVSVPAVGKREWNIASAGTKNPLQLDRPLNINGKVVPFIDQLEVWAQGSSKLTKQWPKEIVSGLCRCLSIRDDNGDVLFIGPDHESLFVLHHDGLEIERFSFTVTSLAQLLSESSPADSRSTRADAQPKSFVGVWKNCDEDLGEELLRLMEDGSVVRQFDDGSSHVGVWKVEQCQLTLIVGEPDQPPETEAYEIEAISDSTLQLFDQESNFRERFEKAG
ncbi:hypothetical protein [Roseiconus lacunae]|uniref:hypothetical protein n=1 Tax=Roseiconus lacunae TaxID=2605694 RepID=UPI001E43E4BE|nr:hypothetical protein [Roseiconus lacunae]MCD0457930.1 hypothetical protein [Roseiconus lacunae]